MENKIKKNRGDVKYSTYGRIKEYIRENQPVKNKSDLMTKGRFDYYSVKIVLDILEKEDKIKFTENGITLKW